jgi:catechol 2,3-dioxygenase-like lactoylglutathione lyase family enzyme
MRPHISIQVRDVARSVDFYRKLFGKEPQKRTENYAKFDLENPALNFSMAVTSPDKVSRVGHFGVEVDSPFEVTQWQEKLNILGLAGKTEEKVDCCYARQDKAWFTDPDGNSWEIFYVHEQLPVVGPASNKAECCAPASAGTSACCAS